MKPAEPDMPEFYQRYINLVQKDRIHEAIRKNSKLFRKLLRHIPAKKIDYAYAPGKWTIKQVLQHIMDTERVFTYRALRFARRDGQTLPGFDENSWAAHAVVSTRNWDDMIKEYKHVRKATELLFRSFTPDDLRATGTFNDVRISVGAIGYMCAGHVTHHMNVLQQRYFC